MKPLVHIIGLGTEGLDKLTLEKYKILKTSDKVWVVSSGESFFRALLAEDINAQLLDIDLFGISMEEKLNEVLDQICHRLLAGREEHLKTVLALPGNPLPEGKFIRGLKERLSNYYDISLNTLSSCSSIERLAGIMAELRSFYGCPWDKEQTHETLKKYLLEEAYEVIEAIDTQNMYNLCEELGDLLLQVVFHARIAEEFGNFTLADVIKEISDKLIRRHPHVFDSVIANASEEVIKNWEIIKQKEKEKTGSKEADYFNFPKDLPALLLAEKTQKKAAKVGFDWEGYQGPLEKVYEELEELEKALKLNKGLKEEFGDLLFSLVNLSRFIGVDAEEALRKSIFKFQKRFNRMLKMIDESGLKPEEMTLGEMDVFWDKTKNEEKFGTKGLL